MIVVFLYLLASAALSISLEKSRRSSTVVCHAILFFFTLVVLLFFTDVPGLNSIVRSMFNEKYYNLMMSYFTVNGVSAIIPFIIVEIFLLLQMLFVAVFFTKQAVCYFSSKHRNGNQLFIDEHSVKSQSLTPFVLEKLFYIFSVMRC